MNGKRLSIRLNFDKLNHQKAFEILSQIPSGRKSEYTVNAILMAHDKEAVLSMVRQVINETLNGQSIPVKSDTSEIENIAMDYLKNL